MTLFTPQDQVLRAAASLASGTEVTSAAIGCHGARAVFFTATATDGTTFDAASTIEVSDDGTNWVSSAATGSGVNTTLTMTTAAMNAGGTKAILFGQGNTAASNVGICWKFARLKNAGNATTAIPGLQIIGNVLY